MRIPMRQSSLSVLFLVLGAVQPAAAESLIVAGDANLGNAINGTSGAPVTAGNADLFTNILGAGTRVLIQDGLYAGSSKTSTDAIHAHYNSQGGVTSHIDTSGSAITSGLLAGVDLFIGILPGNGYAESELSAFAKFLAESGTLFFIGDNGKTFGDENAHINAALEALGSSMRLGNENFAPRFRTTTNIDDDPLTDGVNGLTLAFTANVLGGRSLVRTTDGETFIAYERASDLADEPQVRPQVAPEPSSFALLTLGAAMLAAITWRRRKREP